MGSSFVRALFMSDGMVTITDANGIVLSRVWCALESYVATLQRGAQFAHDIYTAGRFPDREGKRRAAVGLISGFAAADMDGEHGGVSKFKAKREAQFPLMLAQVAASFDVANAQASQEADKKNIMHAVGTRADTLNATVRARCSIGLLPKLLEGGDPQRLDSYCEALAASELRSLSLFSSKWDASADAVRQVEKALPGSLVELSAERIGSAALGGLAARIERGQLLRLTLSSCALKAADGGALAIALGAGGARLHTLELRYARWLCGGGGGGRCSGRH